MVSGEFEVIIQVGGEGGSICLYGIRKPSGWIFTRTRNEFALLDILAEEDKDLEPILKSKSKVVDSWGEAIALLDAYPWDRLYPLEVHPEFGSLVWAEILRRYDGSLRSHTISEWMELCFPNGNDLAWLSLWMKQSKSTVVLTGAGMSTESGIPDFRSNEGWWRKIDPRTVATVDALEDDYTLFWGFYKHRIEDLDTRSPHQGHHILANWEERGLIQGVATQNVDGFHQQACSKRVYELHGSIRTIRCHDCGQGAEPADFLEKKSCPHCGGKLRPNVVLFGEMLPKKDWDQALTAIKESDLVIVIGTSLQVYPVNQLPSMTKGRVVIINAESTDQDKMFSLVIKGKAGEVLKNLDDLLFYL